MPQNYNRLIRMCHTLKEKTYSDDTIMNEIVTDERVYMAALIADIYQHRQKKYELLMTITSKLGEKYHE